MAVMEDKVKEHRKNKRYKIERKGELIIGQEEIKGVITNVDNSGYCFMTKRALPPEATGILKIDTLDNLTNKLIKIKWVNPISGNKFKLGLEIIGNKEDNKDIIKNLAKTVNTEKEVRIIQADESRLNELLDIENKIWDPEWRASKEMFISRIEVFPEGFLCAMVNGKIQGFVSTQITNYDFKKPGLAWAVATDNGFIRNTHNPKGDTLYGVGLSIMAHVDANVAALVMEATARLVIRKKLKRAVLGSRIPSYHKYADKYKVEEYIKAKNKFGRLLDPELAMYQKTGMKPAQIIPNFSNDPESLNYGVLMLWKNPFRIF